MTALYPCTFPSTRADRSSRPLDHHTEAVAAPTSYDLPLDQGHVDPEIFGRCVVPSASAETAGVSSVGAVVVLMNSIGDRYPSAQSGHSVLA